MKKPTLPELISWWQNNGNFNELHYLKYLNYLKNMHNERTN